MNSNLDVDELRAKKFRKMTTEPVEKLIGRLAVPTIISMLVSTFYNMADTYFVGKIGSGELPAITAEMQSKATAAVGVVFALMAIIQAFGFFFGHGSGNYISRALGNKNISSAEEIASAGFFYALFAGLLLCIGGNIFARPLALLLGATPEFLDYTVEYMRVILIGAPIIMPSIVLNNQIRFQGNAFYAMVGISSGAVINLALDPLFIFVFKMEVRGAGIATVISQVVGFILLFIGTERSDCIKIRLRNLRFNKFSITEICRGGVPSLCRQGLASVSTALLNRGAGIYGATVAIAGITDPGTSAVAAMSVVSRIMMFASSALIGFGQGFQPVCGFNYGAKKYDRVNKAFRFCVKSSFAFLLVAALAVQFFSGNIVSLFRGNDPVALKIGTSALKYQCITFPLMAWVITSNMMLQTIGKTFRASLLAMARQGIMFIPAIVFLPMVFGMTGVEFAQPVSDILSFSLAVPVTYGVLKEMKIASESQKNVENKMMQ